MKILMASMPTAGHLNPLLGVAHLLRPEGHKIVCLTGSCVRDRIERAGLGFRAPPGADFDPQDPFAVAPELKVIPPGLEWLQVAMERFLVDSIEPQYEGLRQSLQEFPADVIIGDNMFFGLLPLLLAQRAKRPPVIMCGTSFLHWYREDGAPNFLGLPPAVTQAERQKYAGIDKEFRRVVYQPVSRRLEQTLNELGAGPLSMTLFESVVALADIYMQLSVPSFEFPRKFPPTVNFVGILPMVPNQAPLPPWAHELDGSRKVVLVTQGTVANHNLGLLIAPTLKGLAEEPDVLVVATTGGRPPDAIPGQIPANARVSTFLPFEWLLPKVDVLVTNGGYGTVNQAMSFGIPLVTAGLTEDKADVNARVGWSGVGINLVTNEPTPQELRAAVRSVLDEAKYRRRAAAMKDEFRSINTRAEILRTLDQVTGGSHKGTASGRAGKRGHFPVRPLEEAFATASFR